MKHHPNFLARVKRIQEEFSRHDDGTRTVTTIHAHFIYPLFSISVSTLRRYLSIKIKKEKT